LEKLDGKILNPSAVSKARYELGLPNRYRGNRKKLTYEYWVKVVDFVGKKNNVAKSIINLASLQREIGNYADAEISCRNTLRISLLTNGEQHPETLRNFMHLAWIYRDAERYEEAKILYEKYLPFIKERVDENQDDYKKPLARYKEMLEKMNAMK